MGFLVSSAASSKAGSDVLSQETLILGQEDPGVVAPEVASTAPVADLASLDSASSSRQVDLASFFPYSKGMSEQQMRFCCAAKCHDKGFSPPQQYPPKPQVKSLEDMMSWSHDYHDVLEKALPNGALKLLAERLSGSSYSTAFSGVDCPGSVAWPTLCAFFVQAYFPVMTALPYFSLFLDISQKQTFNVWSLLRSVEGYDCSMWRAARSPWHFHVSAHPCRCS